MDVFLQYLPFIILVVGFVVGYTTLKIQVKENTKDVNNFLKLFSSGDAGRPPFITIQEHGRLRASCRSEIDAKLMSFERDITRITRLMRDGDASRNAAREERQADFTALRKEVSDHHTEVSVMIANIQSDLKHLMKRRKQL